MILSFLYTCILIHYLNIFQNLVTHLIHHIVDGLKENGPMYGRWLFPYERANGWMTRQGLKKGSEEATIMETYVVG